MSSYVGVGQNYSYQLPFASEAVPQSFKSNQAPRVLNSVLQTVVVPSTSGTASAGSQSVIQVPLGQNAYLTNAYLRFKVQATRAANTNGTIFKGGAGAASALIDTYQTSINSTLIDNIMNYGFVKDQLLCHGCSNDWLSRDATVLMNAGTATAAAAAVTDTQVFCLPLIGLLGSQQAFPLWCINGVLSININWATIAKAYALSAEAGPQTNPPTALAFTELALVYDRIAVESDFIAKMRSDMAASGAKFVYNFTNYQSLTAQSTNGQNTINTGLNVSSLKNVMMSSVLTADLTSTAVASNGYSLVNGLSQFQVTLDGRLINSSILDAVNQPAVVFAELQKAFSRTFDASVTDISTKATYPTQSFLVAVSANRCTDGLSFTGSPCSVVGIQLAQTAATFTNFITYVSDFSLLIDQMGSCDLVR